MEYAPHDAKILLYDLESSPLITYAWQIYDADAIKVIKDTQILCFAYKWLGQRSVTVIGQDDFESYCPGINDDRNVVEALWGLFNQADVIIAHNGNSFDQKLSQARMMVHGFGPPQPYQQLDTKLIAKRYGRFTSNKLDDLGKTLSLGQKLETGGFKIWEGCLAGEPKAWKKMKKYNCVTPDHKLLGTDLRWKEIRAFKIGEQILGFDENGRGRKYKKSTIESLRYENAPIYKVTLESGKEFRVTGDHKWLVVNWVHDRVGSYVWKTTEELNRDRHDGVPKLLNLWEEAITKDAGWLAGMYDGEGCLYHRGGDYGNGNAISITQKSGPELEKLLELTDKYSNNNACLNGGSYGTGKLDVRTMRVGGAMNQRLEFLGKVRPERLVAKVDFDKMGRVEARNGIDMVNSVEPAGVEEVAIMGTSSGTFICDGYPMHNCQDVRLLEEIYIKLRPWVGNHPSLSLIGSKDDACPKCGKGPLKRAGLYYTKVAKVINFRCNNCGGYAKQRMSVKTAVHFTN